MTSDNAREEWVLTVHRFDGERIELVFDKPGLMGERESREAQLALLMSASVSAVGRSQRAAGYEKRPPNTNSFNTSPSNGDQL